MGPFARHTGLFVGTIALGQLAIAILVELRGRAVTLGLVRRDRLLAGRWLIAEQAGGPIAA
jgi:hypothetical protein